MRNVNLTLRILNVGDERRVFSRKDGNEHRVAEALVGDETGVVYMTLWDNEIDEVRALEGSTVKLRNGYVTMFRNSIRLGKGRFGKLEEADREIEKVNESNNVSERRVGFRGRGRTRF